MYDYGTYSISYLDKHEKVTLRVLPCPLFFENLNSHSSLKPTTSSSSIAYVNQISSIIQQQSSNSTFLQSVIHFIHQTLPSSSFSSSSPSTNVIPSKPTYASIITKSVKLHNTSINSSSASVAHQNKSIALANEHQSTNVNNDYSPTLQSATPSSSSLPSPSTSSSPPSTSYSANPPKSPLPTTATNRISTSSSSSSPSSPSLSTTTVTTTTAALPPRTLFMTPDTLSSSSNLLASNSPT